MNNKNYTLNIKCPNCGKWLTLSSIDDYCFYCQFCNEHFNKDEINQIYGDWFEISIDMSIKEFETMLETINKEFADACFIGYDEAFNICDIGFNNFPDCNKIKDIIDFFNLKI